MKNLFLILLGIFAGHLFGIADSVKAILSSPPAAEAAIDFERLPDPPKPQAKDKCSPLCVCGGNCQCKGTECLATKPAQGDTLRQVAAPSGASRQATTLALAPCQNCPGGVCRMPAAKATARPVARKAAPQVIYQGGGCANGQCGSGVLRRGLFGRRR